MFGCRKKLRIAEAKLELLAHRDLTRVSAFNKWFCDDTKPREIYAHSGIYLRTDKLSLHHVKDYWQSLTNLDDELIEEVIHNHYALASSFQEKVRLAWIKQLHG